ncbi:peptidase M15B and M15C DD-carboxypeptidase VanY/endolysin [Xylanimonas cellulosilytica DSM 15894]|uniref:Peptidase M15B and M15C DD-carboxypeptidase VanY/endolysin n=1 Tax=Xylanimonas cellulosilytica (strain DSM 15894 / JCM 12276 / CECT 5975 / KCTC 9989 / LMG 20990 / NBRC 107835 / XIL07) TaxID=446471 RepID=D1BRJ9_XYLCX|nr:M15 family metallopeptidase [Xylanimonas cellulosilytica]ACZ30454.1 peptidase M15B and M15C DD-carboxypeptidase VanY/endolysin [Xylanimonas cellulosilytica DSM 15894]
MSPREQPREAARRPRWALLAGSVAGAALLGAVACQAAEAPSIAAPPAAAESAAAPSAAGPSAPPAAARGVAAAPDDADRGQRRALSEVPEADAGDGVMSAFDDDEPTVANLDPALLAALRAATSDAADDGVRIVVNSGWRSAEQQERLLQEAVAQYGSMAAAARWVATPQTSAHVSGDAVDVGSTEATAWLSRHGGAYGLCQIYANEAWHYELRPEAVDDGCPAMYADPTQDPRMQQ